MLMLAMATVLTTVASTMGVAVLSPLGLVRRLV
jgi:hypothetical protein